MSMDDSILWRPQPVTPYQASGRTTNASTVVLKATRDVLCSTGPAEAGCLWLGHFTETRDATVKALIVPKQINHARNYSISAQAMQEVASIARPRKWTLVAAVHSHPGIVVEHSEYDDVMAPSHSALSLVFAKYGRLDAAWPEGVGVHEHMQNYWYLLPPEDAKTRIKFIEGLDFELFDLR